MEIGIFGGSFNPVHCGHIGLADAMVKRGLVDEVWMVLSPQNPLKHLGSAMASDADRMAMLRIACEGRPHLRACDVELSMPRPSYTVDTLRLLAFRYPQHRFRLIIGADNLAIFDRWRQHEYIWEHFSPIVYPRPGFPREGCVEMDTFDVSSTELRRLIAEGAPLNNLLPPGVENYIVAHGLYGGRPGACNQNTSKQ